MKTVPKTRNKDAKQPLIKLKPRELEILILLYRFRYLTSQHIQTLLNHKHREAIRRWLNNLTDKKYITRFYSRKFGGDAAYYCLDRTTRKYVKEHSEIKEMDFGKLARVYKEKTLSRTFQNHCLFLADVYISLLELIKKNNAKLHFYTKTDLHGMEYLIYDHPDAYFAIEEADTSIKRYFLDIFDPMPPRKELYKRIYQYFNYYERKFWQNHNKNPFPLIILLAPNDWAKGYLQRKIGEKLKEKRTDLEFYLSTWEEIQKQGINRQVLHKVETK